MSIDNLDIIKRLIAEKECGRVEFKETTGQLERGMETLCAFLNGEGGTVLFGVTDKGKIIGQDVSDKTKRDIADAIRRIEPFATVEVSYTKIRIIYESKRRRAYNSIPEFRIFAGQIISGMRYFLELRYNGAAYCGWQRQPDQPSVQQTLERALATLLREPVALTGAGRTDTGVNAAYYVAHFDCERPVADPAQTVYKLNFLLPGDIAVGSMTPVAEDAHARFHAREREYRYFIEPRKNPFTRHETWQYYVPLDVGRMNEAAAMLTAYDDFTSFAKLNSNNKTNICRVKEAVWTIDSRGTMCFTIRADRFLRNMVRSLVGTLVDVGRGRYTPDGFRSIVESRDLSRSSAGAPAQGLFLSDVVYPADIFEHQCFSKFKML